MIGFPRRHKSMVYEGQKLDVPGLVDRGAGLYGLYVLDGLADRFTLICSHVLANRFTLT
jgi:hypothetical protein